MSEESKTPEGDYVMMGGGTGVMPGSATVKVPDGLDDPSLSQEDRDHRLAIALQQQENAAVIDSHRKKAQAAKQAHNHRTARSGTFSRLAAVRDKDHGMLSVPADYTTDNAYVQQDDAKYAPTAISTQGLRPQEIADQKLALQLQKVEQVGAGTAREMGKILNEEVQEAEAQKNRTDRSKFQGPHVPNPSVK